MAEKLDQRAKFVAQLRKAANETREENHNGWPVLCDIAADYLAALPSPSGAKAVAKEQIEHMVQRFLGWKLPESFNPDAGISFEPVVNAGTKFEFKHEPVGTNLFDYQEATAMVRYMVEGMPALAHPLPAEVGRVPGWVPLSCKDDKMTCPLPADETVVEVMKQDGSVRRAWYSCNLMEAGDWDFLPVTGDDEPDMDAESIAADVIAWRSADATFFPDIEEVVQVLRPFALYASATEPGDWADDDGEIGEQIVGGIRQSIKRGHLRAARDLLSKTGRTGECAHEGYSFDEHGRCCPTCGKFLVDFGD